MTARSITDTHRDYDRMLPLWKRCGAAIAGSDAVKDAGELYLPKLPGQSNEHYAQYRLRAAFMNASGNTLNLYRSMAFSKAPVLRGVREGSSILEDADLKGMPFSQVLEEVLSGVIGAGRLGVLVDYAGEITEGMSQADASREKARPYLQLYGAVAITNWHSGRHAGKTVLDRVVLHEAVEGEEGEDVEQYRELLLGESGYEVRLWRKEKGENGKEAWGLWKVLRPLMRGSPLPFLPFFFCDPEYGSADCRLPPLLDLVDVNLSHYRTMADLENGRMFCGLATPIFAGFSFAPGEVIKLGSMEGIVSNSPDAKAYYLKTDGKELEALEHAAEQKEAWMVRLGSGLLEEYMSGNESTETVRMRRAGANATLASMAQAVSIVMTKVLKLMVTWAGEDASDVSVQLLTEYLPSSIGPEEIHALLAAVQSGNLRRIDFLARLKVAGVLAQDVRVERIDEELSRSAPREKTVTGFGVAA